MLGAIAFFTIRTGSDSLTRPTLAKIEYDYTLRRQSMLDIEWTFFAPQERWSSRGRIFYMIFPDYYYGIGSQVTEDDCVSYDSRRLLSHFNLLRNLGGSLFTGLQLKYNFNSRVSYQPESPKHDYAELANGSSYSIGYVLLKDKRNHLRTPTKGYYAYMDVAYGHNTLKGSFAELNLDARYYYTFARRFTFATRFYQEFNFGNPSYFDMALMGGDRFVRGFYQGKYRDKHLSTLQAELRAPLWWRIGGAVFAGVSDIYGQGASKPLRNPFFNYGAGVRFLIDRKENTNVRIDYARGSHGNSGLYLSFGENF